MLNKQIINKHLFDELQNSPDIAQQVWNKFDKLNSKNELASTKNKNN